MSALVKNMASNEVKLNQEIEQMKLELRLVQTQLSELLQQQLGQKYLMVYNSGQYRRISFNEIIQIQAHKNYSTFYLDDGNKIFTSRSLKYWENKLNHPDIVRIHNSTVINKNKIKIINVEQSEIILYGNILLNIPECQNLNC